MSLTTQTTTNFEEAASVAAEFITSLDNLPSEVQHLLQEIKIKEIRCQDLQLDIAKDQSRYIKSALKYSSTPSTPSSTGGQTNSRTASPAPFSSLSTPSTEARSKAHLPARIAAAYAEIDTLTNEKVLLAQRIIELVTRTRARLDADLAKVRLLQGESLEDIKGAYLGAGTPIRSSSPYVVGASAGATKRESSVAGMNPVIQIGESLRSAIAGAGGGVETPVSAVGPGYTKKRKLTTNTSIKLPSPAPALVHQSSTTHTRSRLSRSTRVQQQEEDVDADAEGDEDVEADDGEDDTTLYCFCHKQSFGDMIGCDNDDCPYQWFHIECVGVKTPLPDKWYCPECINIVKPPAEKRKGRKK